MTLYETIFILNPDTDETDLQEVTQSVQSFIESNGGQVKRVDNWGRKRLAYEVKHYSEGYFVLMLFESSSELVADLYRQYQLIDSVLKSIVVKFDGDLAKAMEPRSGSEDSSSESAPGESAPGESAPGESVPGESAPGESAPGESVPDVIPSLTDQEAVPIADVVKDDTDSSSDE